MQASAEALGSPPTERSIRWRGIAASLLLHLALIALLLGLWLPEVPPQPAPPLIRVVFGDPGAAGGGGGTAEGQGDAADAERANAASADATAEQAVPAATPPTAEATPPSSETAAVPTPAPAPVAAPVPLPVPVVRPEPKIAEAPPPRPQHKPAPLHTHVASATPAPAAPPVAVRAQTAASAADAAAASAAAPGSGNGAGSAVGQGQGTEGMGHGVFGDGALDGPGDEYLEKLRRWLAKYKQYPQAAIDKKEEGKVIVGFTLKRDGTVLTAWIERSSGTPLLDDAALAMMRRASPVPPVPDRYKGSELKLAMPVDYSIGFFERLFR